MAPKGKLGTTIRKLRLKMGITLRELARRVEVSAAHMSDIEKNRRMPSDGLLGRICHELEGVGANYEELRLLKPLMEEDLENWYERDPDVRVLMREAKDSGIPAKDLLKQLRRAARSQDDDEAE